MSRRSRQETSSREPGQRFHKEILYRDIAWRSFEILPAGLLQRSCQETSYRDLVHRSCQDTSYGDLVQRHCIEILLQRSCQEVSYINLAQGAFIGSLYKDLIKRSCQEISFRDVVQESCQDTSYRDLCRDLALRSLTEICKFPYEVALLQCWHAFRLRRLAQRVCVCVCLRSGLILVCEILPVHFRVNWLF